MFRYVIAAFLLLLVLALGAFAARDFWHGRDAARHAAQALVASSVCGYEFNAEYAAAWVKENGQEDAFQQQAKEAFEEWKPYLLDASGRWQRCSAAATDYGSNGRVKGGLLSM